MSVQPNQPYINEGIGDRGLICGYEVPSSGPARENAPEAVSGLTIRAGAVTWLHFNFSDARARRWLRESALVPECLRDVLQEHDENRRIEAAEGGVLIAVTDFSYEHESDPSEGAVLWCFANTGMLITVRLHPVKSADDLRLAMRAGVAARSGIELAARLLDLRIERLKKLASDMVAQLDDAEDAILDGNIAHQRERLGRIRRWCARLRRRFAPERADLARLLADRTAISGDSDREALQASSEALGFAVEEILEVYERAKLLQEELASRLAESTSRNLYVLSILTAVLLPMTLVTGVFGMNVAGLPGLVDGSAFWWVMVLILASGGVTLALLVWRRLL